MSFVKQKSAVELWLAKDSNCKLLLVDADENENRLVFQVPDTPVSFYIVCSETLHLWSDSDDLLTHLQPVIEWMTSCSKKPITDVLSRAYTCVKPLIETSTGAKDDEDDDVDEFVDCGDDDDDVDDGYYAIDDVDAEAEEKTTNSDSDDDDANLFAAQGSTAAIHRLTKDLKVMQKASGKYGIVGSPRGDNLFIWDVKLTDFPTDTKLGKDLELFSKKYNQEAVITLEMQFPGDFPFSPPFIRVVRPRFKFLTGHVTIGGSICMEMLTKSGWRPTNDIEISSSLVFSGLAAVFVFVAVGSCLLLDLATGWATFDSQYQGSGIHGHNRKWWMGFLRAAGEEIGWRSFLLPCLMERYTAPIALTISGMFWGLFHVPVMILLVYRLRPPRALVTVLVQSLSCALFAFPHGWVAVKSGYSLWASTVMHAVWNRVNPWVLGSIYTQAPGLVTGRQWLINGEGLAGCLVMLPIAALIAVDLS
ncbi:ubiquitin-conjugating enzyme E2 Q1-like [Gigantopelta aegis]|uniref:ubiquitin-conjugating enzyme E2 Q1-like n=1 Tax=Gigantopelta aegis TaxID=1735272 RepID=UPI001B887683|nr:ubiquitin-conjugating enzyme E2 Q1-like [Gigantopelta aegis]